MEKAFAAGIIDANKYQSLQDFNDDTFVVEMVETFIQQNEIYVEELEQAVANSDFEAIRKVLHKMQGSASTVGAKVMTSEIMKLRAFAKSADIKNINKFKERLYKAVDTTKTALLELSSMPN